MEVRYSVTLGVFKSGRKRGLLESYNGAFEMIRKDLD